MELMELLFILAILLMIFGPTKLPELARELGKAIRTFKKASTEIVEAVESPSMSKSTTNNSRVIEEIARKLDIKTEGKTFNQITQEVKTKIESMNLKK